MSKKCILRRSLSLFCAAVILLGMVILPNRTVRAESNQASAPEGQASTTYQEVTFSDFGIADQTIPSGTQVSGILSGVENLDGVAFTGKLQMGLQADMLHSFRLGGKEGDDNSRWSGVGLWTEANSQLAVFYYTGVLAGQGDIVKIPVADYGITYDEATGYSEFTLRVTFDYIDGTSDIKLTISINEKLAYDGVLTDAQNYFGNQLHLWANGGKSIAVKSVDATPATYREVTFSDFGIGDQTVFSGSQPNGALTDAENLDGVAFTGYLSMGLQADMLHSVRIGGKDGDDNAKWSGVGLWTEHGTQLSVNYYTGVIATHSTAGNIVKIPVADYGITYNEESGYIEFKYRVTFDYVEGTADVRITISVNDKLAYDGILPDAQNYFGNRLHLWANGGKTITLKSVEKDAEEEEETKTYQEVTFSDFGIGDQTVFSGSQPNGALSNVENLNGFAFTGYLSMGLQADMKHSVRIGGKDGDDNAKWSGVGLWTEHGTQLSVNYYTGVIATHSTAGNIVKIPVADYGITYDEENGYSEFKYRVTFDYVEGTADVRITISVNDKLAYDGILPDAQNYFGNRLHMWANGGKTITVKSVAQENGDEEEDEEPRTYREVTFYDFGILDQTISSGSQPWGTLSDVENLDGVAFTGRLSMGLQADMLHSVRIGGKDGDDNAKWSGIGLWTEHGTQLSVNYYTGVLATHSTAGNIVKIPVAAYDITYDEENGYSEFKYRVTFDYVEDTADVRITISVNDKLAYDGILPDAQNYFGNRLHMWANGGQSISLRSYPDGVCPEEVIDPAPVISSDFKEISFATFGFEEGIYGTAEQPLNGHCQEFSLDKVVFTDTVCFPENGDVQWRFGGGASPWEGLMIIASGNTLKLSNTVTGMWLPITFDPEVAGCDLVGKDVKISMSFEYVDSDDDGQMDDVKLGVWFNDKAYADRCYYLTDKASELGGFTMFYSPSGKYGVTIKPYYPSLDFTIFGYTKNWAVELGLKKG